MAKRRKPIPPYMVDTLNAWKKSGRTAYVFPFAGKISLNGFRPIPYGDAYDKMKEVLECH